jgi:surface polysaccharide O-acyltransferase-like enzyme
VDLIRTVASFLVILLHASVQSVEIPSNISPQNAWLAFDVYNSISRMSVPLFVMLSGYLLLQPSKTNEPLKTFFKKRWTRVGLPFVTWWIIYFIWGLAFDQKPLTVQSIVGDVLRGPYFTFWFIYMITGLYLLTPMLRIFTARANANLVKLTFAVWFVGTALTPLATLFGYSFNVDLFVIPGWVGYYLLGAYLPNFKFVRRWKTTAAMIVGIAATMILSIVVVMIGFSQQYFFFEFLNITVVLTSAAAFMLLITTPKRKVETKPKFVTKLIVLISINTFPIYLLHTILLEVLQKGFFFGFTLDIMSANPFIMTPVLAVLVLFLSLAIIVPLKKIPGVKRFIG